MEGKIVKSVWLYSFVPISGKEKIKLLVIEKSKQPRCFKGIKFLEVNYDFNKKASMTNDIFNKWHVRFNNKMGLEKR